MNDAIRKNAEQVLALEDHEFYPQQSGIRLTVGQLLQAIDRLEAEGLQRLELLVRVQTVMMGVPHWPTSQLGLDIHDVIKAAGRLGEAKS